jgi:hypothetical protein
MKLRWLAPVALLYLAGCSKLTGVSTSCSGPDASAVTLDIVRDQILKLASKKDEDADAPALSKSKIRATVKQLVLSIEDVRTSKDDPNSTKQFCTGKLKLVAPAEMVSDANDTRSMAGMNSVEDMAEDANVEAEANAFKADIEFNVQPTDAGDKIFSQLESGQEAIAFFAELVKDHLLKSAVADAKAEQDRIASEQQAAQAAASQEQWAASFEEAKAENKMAVEGINAVWKAIPADARSRMLDLQKAWIRRKDASCRVEATANATSEQEIQLARLRCDTREQNSRANELRQYAMQSIQGDSTASDE